ncbi:hypothetical protein F4680DRAFT_421961 [Xylaria scruposa]|nr:hypothetical protein F4680DRAFT_421961 [Xylaria scruposa]
MSKRFTKDDILGGTFPVLHNVLSFGREYRLDNFARLICASGYSNIVQGAIAAPNEMGETALHIAINGQPLREDMRDSPPVAINICVMDMIMEHANDRAFMSRRTHDGNTPLHDLAHYRHCCVRPRECVLNGCKKCRSSASSTIKSFMQTLERLITKYPSALHTPNKAGKTPYVIHLETRQLACEGKLVGIPKRTWVRSNWDNLEYETEPPTDLPTPLPLPDTTFQSKQNDAMDNKSTETHDDEPDEASCRVTTDKKSSKSRYYAKIPVKATDIRNFERRHQSELTTNAGVLFPSRTPHKLKPDGSEEPYQSSDWTLENERQIAIVVSRLLLEGCFSLGNYDKSKTSLFGESQKLPNKQIGFIPQEALNPKTMACHKFLPLHSVLTKVEVHLSNDQPLKVIQASTVSRSKIIRDYNETYLKDVMKWLRETKKVRRILKLVVRDNQRWQCRDETITDIIRGWDIRYLDWNKSDMAIDTIQKAGAKKIVELCLTSSGSNTALIGWSDPDYGLGMFPNLKMIKIRMNPDFESANSRSDYEKKFRDIAKRRFKNLDVEISTQGFMRGGHEGESGVNTGDSDWHGPNRWMKAVREFSSVMSRVQNHNYDEQLKDRLENNRIKVALIDDGVNPQNLGQTRCLEHGEGWPSDDEPYYRSSENHGTVMAKLILELCPYVDIYVAKLNKSAEHNPKYKNSVAEMASQVCFLLQLLHPPSPYPCVLL